MRVQGRFQFAFGLTFLIATIGNAATYTLTPTATLANWSDTTQWNNGSGSSYPGQSPGDVVTVSLNHITLNLDIPLANPVQVNISGNGDLSTTAALTLNGSSSWSGGTIVGPGGLTITSGATMNLNGSGAVLDGTTLTNNGTITLTSASANALKVAGAAKVSNYGTFDVQFDGGMTSDGSATLFNNYGTVEKSAGAGTATIAGQFGSLGTVLAKAGTLAFEAFMQVGAGSTQLLGGNLASPHTMGFYGGKLLGGGKIDASMSFTSTTVEPGRGIAPATLNITGYVQQAGGVFVVDCFANGVTDKYVVGGIADVQVVRLLFLGGYDPADGDAFNNVITGASYPTHSSVQYFPFGHNGTGRIHEAISPTSVSFTAVIPFADLAIRETVGANVPPATTYPVTITVQNLGGDYSSGVHVAVSTSGGSIVGTASSTFSCTGTGASTACTILPAVFAIAPNASATITVNVNVPSGSATVTAGVTANELDPNSANDTATVPVPGAATADLGVAISDSPDPVNAGRSVAYTYTVTNAGPAASTATLSAVIGNAAINGVGSGCVQSTSTLATCTSAPIASGGSATFIIAVTAPPGGTVTAAGSVMPPAGVADPNLLNNSATQTTAVNPLADLSITMHAPVSAMPGGTVTYTLDVANLGPSTASVFVDDPTPAGLTFVKFTDGPCYVFPCTLGPLLGGEKRTIVAVYKVAEGLSGTIENKAFLSSNTPDPYLGNNTAHAFTTLGSTCPAVEGPVPSVVAMALSGQTYDVQWPLVADATLYEIDESADANFTSPSTQTVTSTIVSFTHNTQFTVQTFYYRVRAFSVCTQQFGAYSQTIDVNIAPLARRRAVHR